MALKVCVFDSFVSDSIEDEVWAENQARHD